MKAAPMATVDHQPSRHDLAQQAQQARLVARAHDAVEVAVVAGGAFGQALQHRLPLGRKRQMIAAPIALQPVARDEAAPLQISQRRGQRRLVPSGGAAEHGLADAGVAADEGEQRKAAGRKIDLADLAGEGLERGDLRHAQMEAEPIRQRAIVDAGGKRPSAAVSAAARALFRVRGLAAEHRHLRHVCHPFHAASRATRGPPFETQPQLLMREIVLYPTNALYKFGKIG